MRIILTPLLLLLAGASLRAQWTFLGPHALSNYTDIAINHGVIVAAASAKSPPRITYASNDGGATWDSVFSRGGTRAVAALDTGFILQIEGGNSFRGDATGHVWTQIADPGRNVTRYFYDRSNRRLYAVTQRGALIAFIEVKARAGLDAAAEAVLPRQKRRIIAAAEAWLAAHPEHAGYDMRFDAILVAPGKLPRHIEAAFEVET